MTKPEIIQKTPMNMVELKHHLSVIKKRDGELTFRGTKTEDYLKGFAKLSNKDADELVQKLRDLNLSRLKEELIHKIVDLIPKTEAELKVITQGQTITIGTEDLSKIIGVVKSYL